MLQVFEAVVHHQDRLPVQVEARSVSVATGIVLAVVAVVLICLLLAAFITVQVVSE